MAFRQHVAAGNAFWIRCTPPGIARRARVWASMHGEWYEKREPVCCSIWVSCLGILRGCTLQGVLKFVKLIFITKMKFSLLSFLPTMFNLNLHTRFRLPDSSMIRQFFKFFSSCEPSLIMILMRVTINTYTAILLLCMSLLCFFFSVNFCKTEL